ncbi:MAG: zinc-ribbon domain-containing protein [Butyrivibrio sp.]|nr:zinc-ribbon domain-containing protein [Butyrivibrio sp.]
MYCPECGKKIPDDSVFCDECGARIDEENAPGPATKESEKTKTGSSIMYIAAAIGGVALIIAGFLVFKNMSGKGGSDSNPSETETETTTAMEMATTTETATATETEAVAVELSSEDNESIEETFDEDYPQGFTEEVELTDSDLAQFANRLSTTETAKALDFEWFIDYVNTGGTGSGKFLSDQNQVFLVTGDMIPVLNGGWKAFMFTKAGDYGSDSERYLNAEITIEGEKIYITLNYDQLVDPVTGETIQESAKVKYKGTIDPVTGKAEVLCDDSKIEIENFFSAMDIESEYAVGKFYWISGEIDQFGLMREYYP